MKRQYKQTNVAIKAILSLCLCGIVFNSMSQRPDCSIVEDITLETVTVHLGLDNGKCRDTFTIENINLRVKRKGCVAYGYGCGDGKRTMRVLLTDTDAFRPIGCRPLKIFLWEKGILTYPAVIVDSTFLQKFNDTLEAFEESSASCMNK